MPYSIVTTPIGSISVTGGCCPISQKVISTKTTVLHVHCQTILESCKERGPYFPLIHARLSRVAISSGCGRLSIVALLTWYSVYHTTSRGVLSMSLVVYDEVGATNCDSFRM
ncbi:hypothetical protein VFPPC_16722 [Pochonia chlamydosporia 170]|uniref:Uncharacterized protein n=1 Tax=Pochonia chlamydosporia 170 TaxID=1380566 RepID=A0A179F701_METCM|nr:hypothetical protein VFPPC_16722 [Pochonia chlamydosporia 170]OAQ61246.2 hypothetical protein VFPPC_16722 [Pochonia chlamydosporia 170]